MPRKVSLDAGLLWLTGRQRNLRSFSILRIMYGVAILFFLVPSMPERSVLWGQSSFWVDPEAKRTGYDTFDILFSKDSPLLFDFAFFGLTALVVLFILGCYTRVVLPFMLILLISIQSNNPYVLNGGDTLIRITLIFMLFVNLSEHFSLDSLRRRRRLSAGRARRKIVPSHVSNSVHNVGLILCCFQIVVVYTVSGIWKLTGNAWLDGTALFYALRLDVFMTYPLLNEMLWQSSLMIYVATFVALWVQTLFPLAILWRPTRIFALVSLMFMHFGIAVLMGLWPFSLAMIALDMLFIRDSTWVKILTVIRGSSIWQWIETQTGARQPVRKGLARSERAPAAESIRAS